MNPVSGGLSDIAAVSEALAGFRPQRRTAAETIPVAEARRRVPAVPVTAPHALPGFARSTRQGFAVRAADTRGFSEASPGHLDVAGAVRMGATPDVAVAPGTAVAIPAGGSLPPGADAVIGYTAGATSGAIEVARPVAPGDGVVHADEDAAPGAGLVPAGKPLRAQDLGILAAAGVTSLAVHARPRVTIFSAGDEIVSPGTRALLPGQVRDATAVMLAALVAEAGGEPAEGGIVADDPDLLETALRAAFGSSDLIVVSTGSPAGARDVTAAVRRLGEPGIWCRGLAIRPGAATLLAECSGVPVIGLPADPQSALVVFRLVGAALVRLVGGCTSPPPEPGVSARLDRDVPSAPGRLDVVQVRLAGGAATPVCGLPALLSVLTAADGYVTVPEELADLGAGTEVGVTLYG
jgi:molybdopterin molybdotransferase